MGLIPAHAGKTWSLVVCRFAITAHPRSRGENESVRTPRCKPSGSSPLTRGKPNDAVALVATERLIPAHAGKTEGSGSRWNPNGAHPRSRGENRVLPWPGWPPCGSSPLTRGKPELAGETQLAQRLIPAHAGKTLDNRRSVIMTAAHPRSRGENRSSSSRVSVTGGSSPLTRGKL